MRLYPFFIPHGGCPHRCLFCRQDLTTGRQTMPTLSEVARALEGLLPEQGDGEIAFYGGSFTALGVELQRTFLETALPFVRAGRVGGIRVSTRPDALEGEAVRRLRLFGVTTVEIGCQSFSEVVLRCSGRGHDSRCAGEAVSRLRQAGLTVGLQLMPGLPGGDRDEALYSLEKALQLEPDFLRIYPTVVLKGTPLETAFRAGDYRPWPLDEAVAVSADLLWRCLREGVRVVRVGLQGTPELDSGEIVSAGPYHPAFGQLVRSRLWLRVLRTGSEETGARLAEVHPADLGDAVGHRRSNLDALREQWGNFLVRPQPGVPRGTLLAGGRGFSLIEHGGRRNVSPAAQ